MCAEQYTTRTFLLAIIVSVCTERSDRVDTWSAVEARD